MTDPVIISFHIPGEAVPFARAGAMGKRRFTPPKQADYMTCVRLFGARAMAGLPPLEGPIRLEMRVVYPHPQSWSAKKKAATVWKESRPDADNLFKLVADSLNTIAYHDDAQIVEVNVQKKYGPLVGTTVVITEINNET